MIANWNVDLTVAWTLKEINGENWMQNMIGLIRIINGEWFENTNTQFEIPCLIGAVITISSMIGNLSKERYDAI